jgi:hypothetical protein
MSNSVRKLHLNEALVSYRRLVGILDELSLEEVMAALKLESATQRRRSVTDRLITRAVQLSGITLTTALQEKFHHGKSTEDNDFR